MTPDDLTPFLIRSAYEQGAFPMTGDDGNIDWYQPRRRALFPIEGIRVSHSLARTLRRGVFEVRYDTAFDAVMRACMRPEDNWLSEPFFRAYGQIHREGWGHCAEAWLGGELVGGVYGIAIGGCFCAESMFHRVRDASKVALGALVERCRHEGFAMFDAQVMNSHLQSLGAFEISHAAYMKALASVLEAQLHLGSWNREWDPLGRTSYS